MLEAPLKHPWSFLEIPLKPPWNTHRTPLKQPLKLPWNYLETSVKLPCNTFDTPFKHLWNSLETHIDSHWLPLTLFHALWYSRLKKKNTEEKRPGERTNKRTNARTDEQTNEWTNLVTTSLLELLVAAKMFRKPIWENLVHSGECIQCFE